MQLAPRRRLRETQPPQLTSQPRPIPGQRSDALTPPGCIADGQVRIRLGREPVVLPAPLDTLIRELTAGRHGHAAIGDQGTSPWLFPGGQPGQPISAFQLAERLRQLGVRPGQSRLAAMFQLATELPAAVLARMLGIHITVAVTWQRASAGDWAAYAAEISRRKGIGHDTPR
jgi:hypothetical protein